MVKEISYHSESWRTSGLEELNPHEKLILVELRKRLDGDLDSHLKNDINIFIRFLRARDFKVDLAEDMLRKHIFWRKIYRIDTITTDYLPKEEVAKYLLISSLCFDKENSPIIYFDFGHSDCRGILKCVNKSEIVKYAAYYFENELKTMEKLSLEKGKSIHQWILVVNFEALTFSKATHKPTIDALVLFFQTYEANYPERLKACFILNAPAFFTMFFSIFKPLLSEKTVNKIFVYGKSNWQKVLLKHIDACSLPIFLGGEKDIPDFPKDKLVPEELFVVKNENEISSIQDSKQLTVSRKSKCFVHTEVEKVGTILKWKFESVYGDIGFGLGYKQKSCDDSVITDVIPIHKVDTDTCYEDGMFKCDKPGSYILIFDNDSWIHRKEVFYQVSTCIK